MGLVLAACEGLRGPPDGRGLLLPPPSGDLTTAGTGAAAPFYEALGDAAFARRVFQTPGPAGTAIDIRDAVIGPHREGRLEAMPGAILIDLRSGTGSATAGDTVFELSSQRPVSLPTGTAITLKNSGEVPLVVRLYTVEGK